MLRQHFVLSGVINDDTNRCENHEWNILIDRDGITGISGAWLWIVSFLIIGMIYVSLKP